MEFNTINSNVHIEALKDTSGVNGNRHNKETFLRNDLETGFASIGVFGDRAPASLKASHDVGTSLGTTSKGTHGKTPLPNK